MRRNFLLHKRKHLSVDLQKRFVLTKRRAFQSILFRLIKAERGNSSFIYNVDAIEHAINENKQISFLYFNYDEKHKKVYRKNGNRYTVSPAFIKAALKFSPGNTGCVFSQAHGTARRKYAPLPPSREARADSHREKNA